MRVPQQAERNSLNTLSDCFTAFANTSQENMVIASTATSRTKQPKNKTQIASLRSQTPLKKTWSLRVLRQAERSNLNTLSGWLQR